MHLLAPLARNLGFQEIDVLNYISLFHKYSFRPAFFSFLRPKGTPQHPSITSKPLIIRPLKLHRIISLLRNLQRFFLRVLYRNGGSLCHAFLAETVETRTKNRCVIEATHVEERLKDFPKSVCPRILSLESVDYFGTSEHH